MTAKKALSLLVEIIDLNDNIPTDMWIRAFLAVIAEAYKADDKSYEEYCKVMYDAAKHYKTLWQ